MLYANIGRTGLVVSRLCLGTMSFGEGQGNAAIARTRFPEAEALVGGALDAGVNFIDTGDVYAGGEVEEMLGRALGDRRDEVMIATRRAGAPVGR